MVREKPELTTAHSILIGNVEDLKALVKSILWAFFFSLRQMGRKGITKDRAATRYTVSLPTGHVSFHLTKTNWEW